MEKKDIFLVLNIHILYDAKKIYKKYIFTSTCCYKFICIKESCLPELLRDRLPPELEREEGRRIPFLLSAVEGRDRSLGSGLFSILFSSSGGIGVGDTAPSKYI